MNPLPLQEELNQALFDAIQKENTSDVQTLINQGADVNAIDPNHNKQIIRPLHRAAESGLTEIVRILVAAGADINLEEEGKFRRTPLHRAAIRNHFEVVKLLLKKGANPNILNNAEDTPLDQAVEKGHDKVVALLLDHGANSDRPLKKNLLLRAAMRGHISVVEQLEQNVEILEQALYTAVKEKNIGLVQYLLEKGVDPNIRAWGEIGDTPLHCAVSAGHYQIVQLLLKKGAHVNALCKEETPLHAAVSLGDIKIVSRLLEAEANVNAESEGLGKETPLYRAVRIENIEAVKLLLKAGAEVNAISDGLWRDTPLYRATRIGNIALIKLLLEAGANVNAESEGVLKKIPLHHAVRMGNIEAVKLLLEAGAEVNALDGRQKTLLHYAVAAGVIETVKCLIQAGARINAQPEDPWKDNTPLHYAIDHVEMEEGIDIIELLIQEGADVNVLNRHKKMPLHQAAYDQDVNLVKVLLQAKTDVGSVFSQVYLVRFCLSQRDISLWRKMLLMGLNTRPNAKTDYLEHINDPVLREKIKAIRAEIEVEFKRTGLLSNDLPFSLRVLFYIFKRIEEFKAIFEKDSFYPKDSKDILYFSVNGESVPLELCCRIQLWIHKEKSLEKYGVNLGAFFGCSPLSTKKLNNIYREFYDSNSSLFKLYEEEFPSHAQSDETLSSENFHIDRLFRP